MYSESDIELQDLFIESHLEKQKANYKKQIELLLTKVGNTTNHINNTQNIHICNTCSNKTDLKYVEIPYACKLMFQELITMNIAPRIITE